MWYILNYIPRAGKRRSGLKALINSFNTTLESPLELFAPTFISLSQNQGQVRKTEKPLLYHYIFIKGAEEDIKRLCLSFQGFSFVMDRAGANRYLTIDEDTMHQFRIVAQYFGNRLPCYPLEGINLEEGDRVQIVSGPCAGLTGTYISRKGAKSGNILVAVDTTMAVIVYDVKAEYVRVLEFSRNSRRVYDQVDAFAMRLLSIFANPETPSLSDISSATVFARRLGSVKVNNPKLDAKLQILLYGAYTMLGDLEKADAARARFESLSGHLTNPWTRALALLILGRRDEARALVQTQAPGHLSPLQKQLTSALQF